MEQLKYSTPIFRHGITKRERQIAIFPLFPDSHSVSLPCFPKHTDLSDLHTKYVTVLKFNSSSSVLVSASNSGSVVVSRAPDFAACRRLAGHCERVADLDFSPDETQIVTASFDGSVTGYL